MNKKIKQKWIKALRSGKYQQGKGMLRVEDRFCCLGVLCDIMDNSKWRKKYSGSFSYYYEFSSQDAFPDDSFLDKIGLDLNLTCELAEMNDVGSSFEEIAEVIKKKT